MRRSVMLTGLSGALYAASFPPLAIAPLAWIALAPFFIAVVAVTPGRAALLGILLAELGGILVAWWFPGMASVYFELPAAVGWLGLVAALLVLVAPWIALFAAWLSWCARRGPIGPLLVACGWAATELARARLLTGNPWALLGYSQVHLLPVAQVADLGGPYAVGFIVAAVNALGAAVVAPRLRGRRPRVALGAALVAVAAAFLYGTWRLDESSASGEPILVGIVQGNVERGFSWKPEYAHLGLDRYLALTDGVAASRPALVVWPETAVSFYLQEATPESAVLLERVRALGIDLILGGPHYEFQERRTSYHNSVFAIGSDGLAGRYDKMRLLPLAEQAIPGFALARTTIYSPGRSVGLLPAAGASVGAFVCFEAVYPEFVREFVTAGADLLVNVSNDAWFGHAAAARHHFDVASMRAIENRRYLVRAASTGVSAVIDPHGRVLGESALDAEATMTVPVYRSRRSTFYQRNGDLLAWVAVAMAIGAVVSRRLP